MISHKHKCIFVHIPKTAGTSIEDVIWPNPRDRTETNLWMGNVSRCFNQYQAGGLQHLKAYQIQLEVGEKVFREYYKFSIVRNPWDRLVSLYEYARRVPVLEDFLGMNFNTEFKNFLSKIERRSHTHWDPQERFVTNESGDFIVDKIIYFENLKEEVQK